jgi:hypothetical protein
MNELTMWINFACNIILTVSFTAFTIFLFGRENSFVYTLRTANTVLLKVGICLCVSGALYNALSFSNPPISEVILNAGLAILFSWSAVFHYKKFVLAPVPVTTPAPSKSKAKKSTKKQPLL